MFLLKICLYASSDIAAYLKDILSKHIQYQLAVDDKNKQLCNPLLQVGGVQAFF